MQQLKNSEHKAKGSYEKSIQCCFDDEPVDVPNQPGDKKKSSFDLLLEDEFGEMIDISSGQWIAGTSFPNSPPETPATAKRTVFSRFNTQ